VGTRNWMAPEQLLGKSPKMPCDIYSFGMTIYEVSLSPVALQTSRLTQRLVRFLRMKSHLDM
jgi:serine/threonine protein kinase